MADTLVRARLARPRMKSHASATARGSPEALPGHQVVLSQPARAAGPAPRPSPAQPPDSDSNERSSMPSSSTATLTRGSQSASSSTGRSEE